MGGRSGGAEAAGEYNEQGEELRSTLGSISTTPVSALDVEAAAAADDDDDDERKATGLVVAEAVAELIAAKAI